MLSLIPACQMLIFGLVGVSKLVLVFDKLRTTLNQLSSTIMQKEKAT